MRHGRAIGDRRRTVAVAVNPGTAIKWSDGENHGRARQSVIVSLEAIFLSTFVMISQNRADEKRQVLADHQWQTVQEEEQQNEQQLQLSNQILELTRAIQARNPARSPTSRDGT